MIEFISNKYKLKKTPNDKISYIDYLKTANLQDSLCSFDTFYEHHKDVLYNELIHPIN